MKISRIIAVVVLPSLILLDSGAAYPLEIANVTATTEAIEAPSTQVSIRFQISEAAWVTLYIFDGRNIEIRSLRSAGTLAAGEHELTWDGRDWRGHAVPPEAYQYVLEATGSAGERSEWDLTDLTGGKTLSPQEIEWSHESGKIRYKLSEAGRVRIRVGLDDGPLLQTVIDWVPRKAGIHEEAWDGRDASGRLDLRSHPRLRFLVEAFSLPRNTILVGTQPREVKLIPDVPVGNRQRTVRSSRSMRMYAYALKPIEERGDFPVRFELPKDLKRTARGTPIVAGPVRIRVEVPSEFANRLLEQRFEAVYYVDGTLLFEHEAAVIPLSFVWDPKGLAAGVHYLSTNLRGYEGQFGIATVEVQVEASAVRERK